MQITYEQFDQVEIRSGTIIKVEFFKEARKPAYKIWVDFGEELGIKQSSAQITKHYSEEDLVGKKIAGVMNLGAKKIAGFKSEFLAVGFDDAEGDGVCLISVDSKVPNGRKLY